MALPAPQLDSDPTFDDLLDSIRAYKLPQYTVDHEKNPEGELDLDPTIVSEIEATKEDIALALLDTLGAKPKNGVEVDHLRKAIQVELFLANVLDGKAITADEIASRLGVTDNEEIGRIRAGINTTTNNWRRTANGKLELKALTRDGKSRPKFYAMQLKEQQEVVKPAKLFVEALYPTSKATDAILCKALRSSSMENASSQQALSHTIFVCLLEAAQKKSSTTIEYMLWKYAQITGRPTTRRSLLFALERLDQQPVCRKYGIRVMKDSTKNIWQAKLRHPHKWYTEMSDPNDLVNLEATDKEKLYERVHDGLRYFDGSPNAREEKFFLLYLLEANNSGQFVRLSEVKLAAEKEGLGEINWETILESLPRKIHHHNKKDPNPLGFDLHICGRDYYYLELSQNYLHSYCKSITHLPAYPIPVAGGTNFSKEFFDAEKQKVVSPESKRMAILEILAEYSQCNFAVPSYILAHDLAEKLGTSYEDELVTISANLTDLRVALEKKKAGIYLRTTKAEGCTRNIVFYLTTDQAPEKPRPVRNWREHLERQSTTIGKKLADIEARLGLAFDYSTVYEITHPNGRRGLKQGQQFLFVGPDRWDPDRADELGVDIGKGDVLIQLFKAEGVLFPKPIKINLREIGFEIAFDDDFGSDDGSEHPEKIIYDGMGFGEDRFEQTEVVAFELHEAGEDSF